MHQNPVSIHSITSNKTFHVYPNPVTDMFWVKTVNDTAVNITLTDITGKVLLRQAIINEPVSLSSYIAGVYYLRLQQENGEPCVEKIIKQ